MSQRGNEGLLVALAVVAFVAVAIWVVLRSGGAGQQQLPPMSTYSPRPDGTKALFAMLQELGYDVQRYGELEYHYPSKSCMVLLDEPELSLSAMMGGMLDTKALRLWLEDGGRLVLLSDPLRETGSELLDELSPQQPANLDYQDAQMAQRGTMMPGGSDTALWRMYQTGYRFKLNTPRPALLAGIDEIETAMPQMVRPVSAQVLLASADPVQPLVLSCRVGQGMVLWVTCPEIACNKWIARADNHRLLLALLDVMAQGGTVYFDEHIHGYYKPQRSTLQLLTGTRGGQLLMVFTAVVLLFFAGWAVSPARVRPTPVPPRRQAVEMVLAQADLYQRAGKAAVVVRSMLDGVKRELMAARHLAHLPSDSELADWLDSLGSVHSADAALLRSGLQGLPLRAVAVQLKRLAQACDRLRAAIRRLP